MSTKFDTVYWASLATPPHLGRFEAATHDVLGAALAGAPPDGVSQAIFALGCFWGAERKFWQLSGVHCTAVGYTGGAMADPDYYSVCSGTTGHAEAVLVSYRVAEVSYRQLLALFWEAHDPTQGMRQGADVGTQYRSALFTLGPEQRTLAMSSRKAYGEALAAAGYGPITTEVSPACEFYFAEKYHQQYLAKNPNGYCGLGGTGVACELDSVGKRAVAAQPA
ncbi:peptide-methionine (S)-S-oxide reductase MsrA [Candidatus Foliamicus sp.]